MTEKEIQNKSRSKIRKFLNAIERIIFLLGALVGLVVGLTTIADRLGPESFLVRLLSPLQLAISKFVVPDGYTVEPAFIDLVELGKPFRIIKGESIDLPHSEPVLFSLTDVRSKDIYFVIDGIPHRMEIGESRTIRESKCAVWLIRTVEDEDAAELVVRCSEE